ncbi:hypothetical protein [Panacagrimonas sp.]|uniref:hypothetical protein n=1 Tax=Panacagrimonas sp. TaxID=2480088 RepID=UPI003B5254A8
MTEHLYTLKKRLSRGDGWPWLAVVLLIVVALGFVLCGKSAKVAGIDPSTLASASIAAAAALAVYLFQSHQTAERTRESIYSETLFLVFRCAWDFHRPWSRLHSRSLDPDRQQVDAFRLQKFLPDQAHVFSAMRDTYAFLHPGTVAQLLRFHQALELWRGELQFRIDREPARKFHGASSYPQIDLDHLVKRLADSLQLGVRALAVLREELSNAERVDSAFWATIKSDIHESIARRTFIVEMSAMAARLADKPGF